VLATLAAVLVVVTSQEPHKKPVKSGKELKMPVNPWPEKKVRAKSSSKSHKHGQGNSQDDWADSHLQSEDWGDEDLMQHPIDEEPRRKNRALGEICSYSSDCEAGCCLMERETKVRSCQPRALIGERCSSGQVKGDLYVDACPCAAGMDVCDFPSEICRA